MTLLLGPVLRHVDETSALVWVQVERAAVVEVLGCAAPTFEVAGMHYALVHVTGLAPDSHTPYEVHVDGERVWPPPSSAFPRSVIPTRGPRSAARQRIVFGSCRYVKLPDPKLSRRYGLDALDAYATRMIGLPYDEWPTALLLLGDQVYADELTPHTQRRIAGRAGRHPEWPTDEIVGFDEYCGLYRDAWSDPEIRWMISTVPTAMIFDDHDVRDDWNTSGAWRRRIAGEPWWRERIHAGLAAYWVYQHLGNLSPAELEADADWGRVRAADGDAWDALVDMAERADTELGRGPDRHKDARFSFCWELGRTRLVVIDSRNGRIVESAPRKMISDAEFDWVAERTLAPGRHGPIDHVAIGTSVPWLLPQPISDLQAADEKLAGRTGAVGRAAEFVRQEADLEHWPAFGDSFARLADLLRRVAAPSDGRAAPATASVLSGDVHHSYAARALLGGEPGSPGSATTGGSRGTAATGRTGTAVHQLTCSPVHNIVPAFMRVLFRLSWSRALAARTTRWARGTGTEAAGVAWERRLGPYFGNMIATLETDGRTATARFETPRSASRLADAGTLRITGLTPVRGGRR